MAAPIAHLFLAVQILAGPLKNKFDEKEFIVGTSFPDIRYLNTVSREETHFKNVTLEDIKKETDSFKAGMMFHSFVDIEREKYMIAVHLNDAVPSFRFRSQTIKFAEDQILLEIFNPAKYINFFEQINEKETNFGIKDESIQRWHSFLKEYFKSNISIKSLLNNYFELNYPNSSIIKKWIFSIYFANGMNLIINKIIYDNKLRKIILNFYINFHDLINCL